VAASRISPFGACHQRSRKSKIGWELTKNGKENNGLLFPSMSLKNGTAEVAYAPEASEAPP
jgi:hypothetical protein